MISAADVRIADDIDANRITIQDSYRLASEDFRRTDLLTEPDALRKNLYFNEGNYLAIAISILLVILIFLGR